MKRSMIIAQVVAVGVAALAVSTGKGSATDFGAAVTEAAGSYSSNGEFNGVTLHVACRRTPEMDFIASRKAIFEKASGARIMLTNYPENDLRAKIVADASNHAGGFQVYCFDNNYIPLFAANHWIAPLDAVIRPEYKLDDIFDSLRSSYSWQGHLYGLPIDAEVTLVYYRKDLFEAAGLHAPTTLDDLEADAAKLTKPPAMFGIALRGLRGEGMNVYSWTQWMRSYGSNFLDDTMHPVFDSAASVEGTERYASLIKKYAPPGSGTWGWDKVSSAFAAGRIAMIVDSNAFYPVFDDPKQSNVVGKVGYAVVPAGPKGAFPANYSFGMAVPTTVDPASPTFKAATSFIQWATSQQMEFARANGNIGDEGRKSVNNSDVLKSKFDPAYVKAVASGQAITKTQFRPMIAQWREMGDIIGAQLETVFTGGASPKDALKTAADQVTARFKEQGVLGTNRAYPEVFPDK